MNDWILTTDFAFYVLLSDGQINKITVVDLDEMPTPKRHVLNSNKQPKERITPIRHPGNEEKRPQLSELTLKLPQMDQSYQIKSG